MRLPYLLVLITTLCFPVFVFPDSDMSSEDTYSQAREGMIAEIERDVRETAGEIKRESFSESVIDAMRSVPRHEFVPKKQRNRAYENRPLPIGRGQTISQPYVVALMTDLLEPRYGDTVLEIGTGSGYQAAVLSKLVSDVYSIEIIRELGEEAARRLERLGYENVETRIGDGYNGWAENAPFDGILVTAAISHIPPPLVQQLKPGGRMVIPVGTRFQAQYLTIIEKGEDGKVTTRKVLPVRFVPFTGENR